MPETQRLRKGSDQVPIRLCPVIHLVIGGIGGYHPMFCQLPTCLKLYKRTKPFGQVITFQPGISTAGIRDWKILRLDIVACKGCKPEWAAVQHTITHTGRHSLAIARDYIKLLVIDRV